MARLTDPSKYKEQLIKSNIAASLELQKLRRVVEQLHDNYQESKDACLLERYYMLKEMITLAIEASRKDSPRNIFVAVNVIQTKKELERELKELHKIEIVRKTDKMKKQNTQSGEKVRQLKTPVLSLSVWSDETDDKRDDWIF